MKSFTAEDYEITRVDQISHTLSSAALDTLAAGISYSTFMRVLISIGILGTSLLAGLFALRGQISPVIFTNITMLVPRLTATIEDVDVLNNLLQSATTASEKLLNILNTQPQLIDGDRSLVADQASGNIVFDNVSFGYRPDIQILQNITLDIPSRETLAIVGTTGAGKSTIAKLLLRFYDATEGRILLGDTDIRSIRIRDLRAAIGFVSQDMYLFHGTVHENIMYGRRDASMEEAIEAARIAELHDFIMQLPEGYDTVIGEHGQRLSTGQRQRLSIARAVLKNAPILILDEATSSVDNATEVAIQRSMERFMSLRTVIVIAHRLSTIRTANRILVIEQGELQEMGSHEELLAG